MIGVAIIGAGIGREHLAGYRALPDRFAVRWLIDLDTAGRKLSLRPGPIDACAPFGLATWQSSGEFKDIRWRPL